MLILLYGHDDYRRIQKKRDLIAEFKKKHSGLGIGFFDFEKKEDIDAFDAFTKSSPLFDSTKLAVLEHAFEIEAKQLAKLLEPFAENKTITILLSERDKPVKAVGFLLDKPTISQKFENLEGAEFIAFLGAEAKKLGLRLGVPAAQFLAEVYAGNSWALATELQKLSAYKKVGSATATIEKKDLESFDLEAAPNYWMLLNGVKSYDLRNRLYALEKLFATNDPPAKLFNILASQWKEKLPQCAEFDFAVKSGKLEYEEALVALVIG
jgi:DNA polymerase III delta subunit